MRGSCPDHLAVVGDVAAPAHHAHDVQEVGVRLLEVLADVVEAGGDVDVAPGAEGSAGTS